MKLCPQCAFIYEDDQGFCDMDGNALVYDPAPVIDKASVTEARATAPTELAITTPSRSFAAAIAVVAILMALVIALYIVRTRQARSSAATEASTQLPERSAEQPPAQSTSEETPQPAESVVASTQTAPGDAEQSNRQFSEQREQSLQTQVASADSAASQASANAALAHTRLTASPVSAGAPTGNSHAPVIVRLKNGAAIVADEAWEKREGVWYRQAGMVTFLKRSSVRAIERPPAATSSKPFVNGKSRKMYKTSGQTQLRLARLEPIDTKKPSRFTSLLKKTGRFLTKPFNH